MATSIVERKIFSLGQFKCEVIAWDKPADGLTTATVTTTNIKEVVALLADFNAAAPLSHKTHYSVSNDVISIVSTFNTNAAKRGCFVIIGR